MSNAARLTLSLEIDLLKDTPDGAIRSISDALNLFGRQNGGTLGPWLEQRSERRGVLHRGPIAVGTWRVVDSETVPREIATRVMNSILSGRHDLEYDDATLHLITYIATEAIREDRRTATRILPDEDF